MGRGGEVNNMMRSMAWRRGEGKTGCRLFQPFTAGGEKPRVGRRQALRMWEWSVLEDDCSPPRRAPGYRSNGGEG